MAGAVVGTVAVHGARAGAGEAVDQRADIYAFGLILYDMLLGRRGARRRHSAIAELTARMQDAAAGAALDRSEHSRARSTRSSRMHRSPTPAKRFQTTASWSPR